MHYQIKLKSAASQRSNPVTRLSAFLLTLLLSVSAFVHGQIVQTFNSSGSFTVPAGVTSLTVYIYGAGGGGGGGTTGADFGNGGGGGGGASSVNAITVSPAQVYTVTVGAGGTAGTPTANGGTGGTSTFAGAAGTFTAAGGLGGTFSTGLTGTFAGGAGGSTGTGTVFSGGNGSAGDDTAPGITGSGGGGAGSAANGSAGPASCTGVAAPGGTGTYPGGNGGYNTGCGTASNVTGAAGLQPGGGGSGDNSFSSNLNGGAGGAGRIIVVYTPACTTPAAPTTLALIPGYTSVTGTFTAPATPPTNYLVIRTTTAAAPSTPVQGTTYTAGTTALGGTIVSTNTTTGFTDNGLAYGTQYWYWIYAYNSGCASTNPVYSSTSLNGNTTTTACTTQTNTLAITAAGNYTWSTAAWSRGHAPLPCEDAIITGSGTINGTATINLAANTTVNSLSITLTGAGANGATALDKLFFNTNAFALTITNDLNLTNTSAGNGGHQLECNISASGSLTCNNFNTNVNGTGGNNTHILDVNSYGTFQVNGVTLAKATETSGSGGQVLIGVGDLPATAIFNGTALFDDGTTSSVSSVYLGTTAATGNTTGTMVFKANATFGAKAFSVLGNTNGSDIFDASSAQTLTVNNATTMYFPSVLIGNANSPVVTMAGTGNPILNATAATPTLSVNNNSVLDLGTYTFNVSSAVTSTISLAAGATLKVGGTTGGTTGSNFPLNYSTYTFAPTSTVEYNGAAQTIFATPAYGALTLSATGTKTAGAALTVNGNFTINSPATFAALTYTHNMGGNWVDAGTFTPATSKIRFNGSGAQSITKTGGETFAGLIVNKATGLLSLNNNITVTAVLNLTNGILATGANTLTLGVNGSTNNASSANYVNGTMLKAVANSTLNPTFTFPIGDATSYTPVTLTGTGTTTAAGLFGGTTTAGDLTTPTGSGFDYAKSVNRNWTLGSNLAGISAYAATFNYPSSEVDAGTTPANFVAKYTNGTVWTGTTVSGTPTNTSTSVTGIASLSTAGYSFQIAQLLTFAITSSAGNHGSISPNGTTNVSYGANQTYTITPNACYSINKVLVDGVNNAGAVSSGTYTFSNVTATHTISTTYSQNGPYTITVTAGANGSITPGTSNAIVCGSNATYTITPAACYSITDVLVDGASVGALGSYTFSNVIANHTISASFSLNTYTITATSGPNGTVTPAGASTVNCGSNKTYTITPAACYSIANVLVDGVSAGAVTTYTFSNVTANHTISATFAINTYTATVNAGANGTITPGSATVNCGSNNTYTITANACYHIVDVTLNGVSQGAVGTLNVNNVQANYTVAATFAINTYTATVNAGANGTITPGSATVNCGSNNTYTITANACYHIVDVTLNGVSQGAVGTLNVNNVQANYTVAATFAINTYAATINAGANGTITPGSGTVNCGSNNTYTITPDACYHITDVTLNGVSQGAVSTLNVNNVQANYTVAATFAINTYTITATSGANGTVTPAGATTVNCGANQTYTITPDACYSIADVLVDGVSVGAVGTYTFTNVTASHTISATFSLNTFTITATSGANGTVTPAGATTVNCGANQTYTITPDACYSIADVLVDGVSVGAVGTYTFTNVTASHTISATFSLNTFTITATSGANGTVTPAGATTVNCGANQAYTITPDACYSIADVLVDGVSVGAVGTYTFTNVTASHTISATFSLNTFTITATSGANGTVTPAGATTVNCGANQTYTITPDACYSIADVLVDGSSVGAVGTYTFTNVAASHTISASFSLNTYTITATSGANGTVTPAGATIVNCGSNQAYTITPDACYSIADVLVDGVSVGAVGTYTFTNVTASHTISATFSLNTYTITATSGANGTVTPAGATTVNCGANQTYTITPDACYSIADVLVDGVSVGAIGTYTFTNVTASHTISATFSLNTYTITATSGANGTVTPAGATTVNCGSNQTYTITPDACYSIADVLVDGGSVGAVGTYTFTNVTASHTISATFALNTFTITATSGANGTVTPAGATTVNCGANQTYTSTPDACYSIADVLVDGVSVGAVGTYTFTNVTASHTISATFSLNTYTITATSGANGSVTPAGATTVNCGSNQTYTITPDACYSIADVLVDGVSVGAVGTYTFTNVTASHTISATFSLNTFTITATSGANGTVTPAGATTVNCGANQTYAITPNACYSIADVLVDGVSVGAVGTYTFTNVTTNHTISATFSLNTYTITATSGANGTVTPAGATTVNCGANQAYTITPDACYSIADVLVDGVSVGAVGTYTFNNVTTNHTISATFSLNTYTITATSGANGTVTPAGATTVNCGANQTYTITPDACYSIADVLVDGVSVGAVGTYTFTNVTASHTISATFSLNTFTITATSGANGTVTPAGVTTVNCGANQTYTITPDACYSIADVLVDGLSVGAVGTYTFTNVTTNHTISATFSLNTYTITATSGANGTVTPAGATTVNCGANQTYTITPDACYSIADVLVDGVSVGAVGTYTFNNVTASHTISATFSLNTFTITATSGANGTVTPAGATTVNCGANQTYTITPAACYSSADVLVDGVSVGAIGTYTFNNVTANHTISATFSLNTFTITATSGANGTVTPAGATTVNCGANQTYTITPDACYSIADVLVDGVSVGAVGTYTFTNVTASHTISATFSLNTFTITATSGANGTVTPAGATTVNCGANQTYTITPDACYSIADVLVDGVSVGAVGTYTFTNVTASHTISATFSLNTYTITATSGANGTVTPAGATTVNCGANQTYTITPAACYSIADVLVDGVSAGAVGTYTFTNVTASHTISATFSINTFTITATSGANGTVTPAGATTVNCGANQTYTITPDACYSIADVLVDGVSVGAVGTYTFTNVTASHTISATFSLNTSTITATSGANGTVTPAGATTVNCGANQTYTITPAACYSIADVLVDGVSVGAVGTYTFNNVTASHTISATFSLNTYAITATSGANGTVTPAGATTVNCGANQTYTITPAACYSIANVLVDGVSVGAVGTYTFTNVTAGHTISASFVAATYTINASAGAGGTITPSGAATVACGGNATYTIAANNCYSVANVVVDGISQGAVSTYTFTNVTANHTISATFTQNTYTTTVSAGANGTVTPGTGAFNCGSNSTYTITANACYHVADVIVDGSSVGAVTTYTFTNITANHTISASFAINATLTAPTVTGPVNVCTYIGTGTQVTYTATSAGATGFTWVIPPSNVTIVSGQGTANLTVTFQNGFAAQGNKQLRVTATSACGNSSQTLYVLVAQTPGTPGPITGNTNICPIIGTAATYTYTINSVLAASSYIWTVPSGATIVSHPAGTGANDTVITVSFSGSFVNNTSITVASANNCNPGGSAVRSLAISRPAPATPGLISGPGDACPYMAPNGTPATYSIAAVAGATSYTWTVPGGVTITGQGTTSISFTYASNFTSGSVTVTATNGCGISAARSLGVSKYQPAAPSIIDIILVSDCPNRVYSYTISSMPANAVSIQWIVPAGATIVSGQGTTSITVSYPATSVNGNITAQAINNCSASSIRSTAIRLPTCAAGPRPFAKLSATQTPATAMQVSIYPNPSVSDYRLKILTAGTEKITVKISDMRGREFKNFIVLPYQTINVGADLKAGAYILEVRQGDETQTSKLIKF